MRHALFVAGLLFLAAGAAGAQEQTASIAGVLRDATGAILPGTAVTATHSGGWAVATAADTSGWYRFPALPPGQYMLTVEAAGFAPTRVANVELLLGQRLEIPLTLAPASVHEEISVIAETPLLPVTQSARATSLRAEELDSLPIGRDFRDVVGLVPGANPEPDRQPSAQPSGGAGLLVIDGSSGAENRFIVDGAESTDLVFGSSARPVVPDFLDEIQVKSSGYSAEFGGSTGGVLNAVTKSGGNTWQGEALLYWNADWLDAADRPVLQLSPEDSSRAGHVNFPKDDYWSVEPGLTIGGPLLRDRLWLFAGYLPGFEPIRRTAPFSDGTTATLRQDREIHNAVATLSAQLGSRWRARASYSLGHVREDGQLQNRNGTSSPDAGFDEGRVWPGWSLSGSVDWAPSPRFYTSLRATWALSDERSVGVHEGDLMAWRTSSLGLPGVPPEYQRPTGFQNVPNTFALDHERMGRLALQWDASLFFDAGGRHRLKAGVQLDRRSFDIHLGHTGNFNAFFWNQSFAGERGPFGYYFVTSNVLDPNRGNTVTGAALTTDVGLFIQDAWTVGERLTLNLGLRAESEDLPSFSRDPAISSTAIHFGFADKLAPRLGFAWDATGDGRTRLWGSWGLYYDIMKLRLPIGVGAQFISRSWYTLDTADLSLIQDNDRCPPECPGRLIRHLDFLVGRPLNDPNHPDTRIDPDLEPMRVQELVFGIEREVAPNVSVSARYVHKQLDRGVEHAGFHSATGTQLFVVGNPGFGRLADFVPQGGSTAVAFPRARRDYDALELGLRRRMANRWSGRLSWVWSRLWGNYSGLSSTDFQGTGPNFTRSFDSPLMAFEQSGQPVGGPLGTDRTHQVKAQLVYDFGDGMIGASWFGASGIPRTRQARLTPGEGFPIFYAGRESDGRMPFATRLDLQLQYRIPLGEGLQLTLIGTAFNVFDQATATDFWTDELFPGQAIAISEADYLAGVDTQQLIAEQGLVSDPRFLMDRRFQAPRTIRFAARLRF